MSRALFILDPQNGWKHPAIDPVFSGIPPFAKKFDGLVMITKFVNAPNSPFKKHLDWDRFSDDTDHSLIEGYAELSDNLFEHNTYGCLNDDVKELLTANSIRQVYLAGVFTDVCVAMTAMQLFDEGFEPFVIKDLVGTLHGGYVHDATLKSLNFIIGARHLVRSTDF